MISMKSIESPPETQVSPGIHEVQSILETLDASNLLDRLTKPKNARGPRGFPPASMWRAFVASYILNLPSTNALVRRLEDKLELRLMCGFSSLPTRWRLACSQTTSQPSGPPA